MQTVNLEHRSAKVSQNAENMYNKVSNFNGGVATRCGGNAKDRQDQRRLLHINKFKSEYLRDLTLEDTFEHR